MNKNAEELHDDLTALAKKHKMNHALIMFQEESADPEKPRTRVIAFSPGKKFDLITYAKLFIMAINVSETLRKITDKASEISITALVKEIHTEHELQHPENRIKN